MTKPYVPSSPRSIDDIEPDEKIEKLLTGVMPDEVLAFLQTQPEEVRNGMHNTMVYAFCLGMDHRCGAKALEGAPHKPARVTLVLRDGDVLAAKLAGRPEVFTLALYKGRVVQVAQETLSGGPESSRVELTCVLPLSA